MNNFVFNQILAVDDFISAPAPPKHNTHTHTSPLSILPPLAAIPPPRLPPTHLNSDGMICTHAYATQPYLWLAVGVALSATGRLPAAVQASKT
jgi:hypothetical protein